MAETFNSFVRSIIKMKNADMKFESLVRGEDTIGTTADKDLLAEDLDNANKVNCSLVK